MEKDIHTAVNALAIETARNHAHTLNISNGANLDAYQCAVDIGRRVCEVIAEPVLREACFAVAARYAKRTFEACRVEHGAPADEAQWKAFASASSVVKRAVALQVFDSDLPKGAQQTLNRKAQLAREAASLREIAYVIGSNAHEPDSGKDSAISNPSR